MARVPNPMPHIRNLAWSVRETERGVRRFFAAMVLIVLGFALVLGGVFGPGAVLLAGAFLLLVLTALEPSPYSSSRTMEEGEEGEEGEEEKGDEEEEVGSGDTAAALADSEPAPTTSIRPPDEEGAPSYRIEPPPEEPLETEEEDGDLWV